MSDVIKKISKAGVIPVIRLDDVSKAEPLANALAESGLPIAEVTFRTEGAASAIKRMRDAVPNMLVGAGTVLTCQQVNDALEAGAEFIVSPGLNPKVVKFCIDADVPIIPGAVTPTEIEAALEFNITTVKFFPAEQSGGLKYIKAVSAPYSAVTFIPTGGITIDNLTEYLSFSRVIACGGSWMVKPSLINAGDFSEIKRITRQAVDIVRIVRSNND